MRFEDLPMLGGAHPVFGHVPEIRDDRLGFVARLAEDARPFVRLSAPLGRVAMVNDPKVLAELLVERARHFEKSAMTRFTLYPLAGEGLFTSTGELWRKQRKVMSPIFHPAPIERYAPDMVACAERTLADYRDGQERSIARDTTLITMSVAGKTLFDADTFDEADELGAALTVALEWTGHNAAGWLAIGHIFASRLLAKLAERAGERAPRVRDLARQSALRLHGPTFLPGAEGAALRRALDVLDQRVARMIDARRTRGLDRPDLLTRLLAARDDDGAPMSDRQVRDEVLTLFVAGHETTAAALAWALYELARAPALYDAVEAEADALGGPPGAHDLPRLALTTRVFKEALRKYPPVYLIGRDAVADTELGGAHVPRDTNVSFSPYSLHFRPDLWPEPARFEPARFTPEAEAARHRYAYLPFGAGPRVCIGMGFAMLEGPLVLATMLRHARFEALGDDEPVPSATLRPKRGVPMRVRLRRPPS